MSFQHAQIHHNQPNVSLVLLIFLLLFTFNHFLLALYIKSISAQTLKLLEKVGVFIAIVAFSHAIACTI